MPECGVRFFTEYPLFAMLLFIKWVIVFEIENVPGMQIIYSVYSESLTLICICLHIFEASVITSFLHHVVILEKFSTRIVKRKF